MFPTPLPFDSLAAGTASFSTLLGDGATGEVFFGDLGGNPVAVKRLKVEGASPEQLAHLRRRFEAELNALGRFRHPRIVRLLHYSLEAAKPPLLVFELLEHGSLADRLSGPKGEPPARGPPLTALERVDVALGVAHGLAYLHGLQEEEPFVGGDGGGGGGGPVVHRDVKSANVGLARPPPGVAGGVFAKILDCGLAKALRGGGGGGASGGASFTSGVLGTPGYMGPELADGDYTIASEVYSFGVVLLELLSGARVGPRTASDVRRAAEDAVARGGAAGGAAAPRAEPGVWPPAALDALCALVADCLHAREEKRPAGFADVLPRLRALRGALAPPAGAPTTLCPVCWEDAEVGMRCKGEGHFLCGGCLLLHVRACANADSLRAHGGGVPCATAGCAAPPWAMEELEKLLDVPTALAFIVGLRYYGVELAERRRAAEAELAAREAAAAALKDRAERVARTRLIIVERDLTLRCPQCLAAFVEWTGCAALTCSDGEGGRGRGARRGCGAAFCGLCLEPCPAGDAHEHCQRVHGGVHFGEDAVKREHKARRLRAVAAALRERAADPPFQAALLAELAKADLPGVGIAEEEVAREAGMAAAPPQPPPPQPPPQPPPPPPGPTWTCDVCTLENGAAAHACVACDSPRAPLLPPHLTQQVALNLIERYSNGPFDPAGLAAVCEWALATPGRFPTADRSCERALPHLIVALGHVRGGGGGGGARLPRASLAVLRLLSAIVGGDGGRCAQAVAVGAPAAVVATMRAAPGASAELAAEVCKAVAVLAVGSEQRKRLCREAGAVGAALAVLGGPHAADEGAFAAATGSLITVAGGDGMRELADSGLPLLLEDALARMQHGGRAHQNARELLRRLQATAAAGGGGGGGSGRPQEAIAQAVQVGAGRGLPGSSSGGGGGGGGGGDGGGACTVCALANPDRAAACGAVAHAPVPRHRGGQLTARCVATLTHKGAGDVNALAVVEGGALVSGGDTFICAWAQGADRGLKSIAGKALGIAALPGGRFATADGPTKLAEVWDAGTGARLHQLRGHTDFVWCVAALPGGLLASGSYDKTVRIWNAATGAHVSTLEEHTNVFAALPDGRLASGSNDNTVRLWNVVTRDCTQVLQHPNPVYALAVLDGGRLASGCGDNCVYIWSLAGGVQEAVLAGHTSYVASLAALPNGLLASGSADKTVRVWDVGARACVAVLEGHGGMVLALAALPDGRLASGSYVDPVIRVWTLSAPGSPEDAAAATAEARRVVVAPAP